MDISEKTARLKQFISKRRSAAVAYSGGVDSSYLSKVVFEVLGKSCLAITVDSMFIPRAEIDQAKKTAREIGIRHKIVTVNELPSDVLDNDKQRCYQCKKAIFSLLLKTIKSENITTLFDGSNVDDLSDYRPGMKALKKLRIESPLLVCEFTKQDIRDASKIADLSTWNHPSLACLASRVPYHTRITNQALDMVEKAEAYLKGLGFQQLRVRHHEELARIEVAAEDRSRLFDIDLMNKINDKFKALGFKYVSLDLEGYKTGKMN